MKLIVLDDVLDAIVQECARNYPEECCGVLLGKDDNPFERAIVQVLHVPNQREDERTRRYLIGPDAYRFADQAARAFGLDILGFYHSHPDHPAVPSTYDREHAWPWYAYMIVPVQRSGAGAPLVWVLSDDRTRFDEVELLRGTRAAPTSEAG